ncbi:ABC transporter substrate-binding protein [soil metagenome]
MGTQLLRAPSPSGRGFHIARATLALTLAILVTACQTAPAPPPSPAPTVAAAGSFPRTLVDDDGTEVTVAAPPERILGHAPAITETVFALGAGERLVGGTDFDDYPAEAAAALPDVATFTGVLMEQVVALEPDIVLAAGNNFTSQEDIDRMRDLGMTVLVTYAESVDEVLADIELIGQAIDAAEEATAIVGGMEGRIAEVEAAVADIEDRPRVFYQIGSEPEIYGPAPNSFVADMVALAGGEPITTTDPAVFSISVERLVDLDPEVIVLGDAQYGVCPADVAARPGWSGMTAVSDGAIRPVEDTIVTRPGPRVAEGLAALALAVHPDADISPPAEAGQFC